AVQLGVEGLGKASIPALGHARRLLRHDLLIRVVIDVEVLGAQALEVERLVLHLVAPEVLLGAGGGGERDESDEHRERGGDSSAARQRHGRRTPGSGALSDALGCTSSVGVVLSTVAVSRRSRNAL